MLLKILIFVGFYGMIFPDNAPCRDAGSLIGGIHMVMQMDLNRVKILPAFEACPPRAEKLERKRAYYAENGRYDRMLSVDGRGWLVDGYATYLVMKENGETKVEAEFAKNLWPAALCEGKGRKRDWYSVPMRLAKKLYPGRRVLLLADGSVRLLRVRQVELFSCRPCWPAHGFALPEGGDARA